MNILDALKETGKAVRACWTDPKEGDCVAFEGGYINGVVVYCATNSPVYSETILKDDWIPYSAPEKEKCGDCQHKERLDKVVADIQGEGFQHPLMPLVKMLTANVHYLLGDRCMCEAEKKFTPSKDLMKNPHG